MTVSASTTSKIPARLQPYWLLLRWHQPTGIWLLLWPCWWSLALAMYTTGSAVERSTFLLFALGAALMRGAGCIVNDLADQRLDAQVARTQSRPLPAGMISRRGAALFLCVLLLASLIILLQFNPFTVWLGMAALPLVAAYPFMKRFTYWPQAFLGLTFNWGALLGWAAVTGALATPALLLYAAGFFWTLGYDTIYAHQDKNDDLRAGIKSTALRLGRHTKPWLLVFYAQTILLLAAAGHMAGLGWLYAAGITLAAAQLLWQVITVNLDDPASAMDRFRTNAWLGGMVFLAIVAGWK